jgi:predicted MPP superfamily phosphohydrolase
LSLTGFKKPTWICRFDTCRKDWWAEISSLEPDLVVITGDFMTSRKDEQVDNVARVLEYLESPPLGCFAVLGNHDYGPSWFDPDVAARLHSRLSELGIAVLRNSSQQVEGLLLVGLDDYWGPNFRPRNVLSKIPPEQASLVLCHNPDAADQPVWSGYRGWILAGHTHGGQCKPPFLRSFTLPVKNSRYSAGVVDLHDGRMLYINPGLGYLRRVRFNVRPEVTVFRLTGLH